MTEDERLTIINFSWWWIKHDFLHNFHKPCLDLLVWILVKKLVPHYERKLNLLLNNTGQYCELPSWHKAFKCEWKKLAKTPIEMPINLKYWPDIVQWVCTCPYFVTSCFLVCKHLVQSLGPIPTTFYLQVKGNWTTPFWLHLILQPQGYHPTVVSGNDGGSLMVDNNTLNQNIRTEDSEDEEDSLIDMEPGLAARDQRSFCKQFSNHISTIWDFCDSLEYQLKFEDHWILETLEREGASFLWLMQSCLSWEHCMNLTRGTLLTTWEMGMETASAMFYQTRPPHCNAESWSIPWHLLLPYLHVITNCLLLDKDSIWLLYRYNSL